MLSRDEISFAFMILECSHIAALLTPLDVTIASAEIAVYGLPERRESKSD